MGKKRKKKKKKKLILSEFGKFRKNTEAPALPAGRRSADGQKDFRTFPQVEPRIETSGREAMTRIKEETSDLLSSEEEKNLKKDLRRIGYLVSFLLLILLISAILERYLSLFSRFIH